LVSLDLKKSFNCHANFKSGRNLLVSLPLFALLFVHAM